MLVCITEAPSELIQKLLIFKLAITLQNHNAKTTHLHLIFDNKREENKLLGVIQKDHQDHYAMVHTHNELMQIQETQLHHTLIQH